MVEEELDDSSGLVDESGGVVESGGVAVVSASVSGLVRAPWSGQSASGVSLRQLVVPLESERGSASARRIVPVPDESVVVLELAVLSLSSLERMWEQPLMLTRPSAAAITIQ